MPATAIDIGTHSIKIISGKPGKNPVLNRVVELPNALHLSIPQDNTQAAKLQEIIGQMFDDHKLSKSDVYLSLPEEIMTTKVINLPPLSNAELASAIDWQAEQYIPIPLDQLSLEYQVLYRPPAKNKDESMRVLLVGTRKSLIDLYVEMFLNLGIQPTIMETQIFSIIRALNFELNDPTSMIVHLGADNTQLAVVNKTELELATNKKGGGALFTRAIQQAIANLTPDQAESYKTTYGLMSDQLQGKIKDAILPTLDSIGQEVVKTLRFFNNEQPNTPVSRIVLTGGGAQMPGIVNYFSQLTSTETLLASPFATVSGKIPEENQQAYIVCVGLMMRQDK